MNRNVALIWTTHRPMVEVRQWVESSVGDTLRKAGYRVDSSTAGLLVMSRARTQWPLAFVSALAFWMSDSDRSQMAFRFQNLADGSVEVFMAGLVPRELADILEALTHQSDGASEDH